MLSRERNILRRETGLRRWAVRSFLVGVTLLSWLSHSSASSADSSTSSEDRSLVRVEAGRASVDVDDASLSEVLGEIASRAGIKLVLHGLRDERVSARFHSLPLDEALSRLIKDNFVFLYSSGDEGQVAEIWIGDARASSQANSSEESRLEAAARNGMGHRRSTTGESGNSEDQTASTLSSASSAMNSLVHELRAGDTGQRRRAVWELADYQDAAAREALTTALKTDADPEVRQRAAWLLEFQTDQQAVSALTEAVSRDPDESVRQRAVESLAKVGGQSAIDALSSALRDPSPFVRYEALTSLTEVGGELARASISRALRDPDELVRDKAAELLAALTRDHQ